MKIDSYEVTALSVTDDDGDHIGKFVWAKDENKFFFSPGEWQFSSGELRRIAKALDNARKVTRRR